MEKLSIVDWSSKGLDTKTDDAFRRDDICTEDSPILDALPLPNTSVTTIIMHPLACMQRSQGAFLCPSESAGQKARSEHLHL